MKKRICAVLLSLCSLIGGAERKSDASVIGKILKYGSCVISGAAHIATAVGSVMIFMCKEDVNSYFRECNENFKKSPLVAKAFFRFLNWLGAYGSIVGVNLLNIWLIDSPCLHVYTLGKYLDGDSEKSSANQEKKSSKETVLDKNKNSEPKDKKTKQFSNEKVSDKNSKPKDKNPTLNENSKKTKV